MLTTASRTKSSATPPQADGELDLQLPAGTLQRFANLRRQHGDLYALRIQGQDAQAYVVSHPDFVRQVLCAQHSHYRRFILDGHLSLVLGKGLLISEGQTWKSQRKLLQKCFHGRSLDNTLGRTSRCNAQLVERWEQYAAAEQSLELTAEMLAFSIELNLSTLFGDDAPVMRDALGLQFIQQLTAPSRSDTRRNLQLLRDMKQARLRILALMAERRSRATLGDDLLAQLMAARYPDGQPMPDEQTVDEIVSILLAGHETVASALTSLWHLLAQHADVADAMRREIDQVVGDAGLLAAHTVSLDYCRMALLEALRLYPPVWVISHRAELASTLGSCHIPAGSIVFVNVYQVHRHGDFWPDAQRFAPQRFDPAACAARHGHAYIPHSIGPRNCIGDDLSMQEMLLTMATLLRRFDLQPVSGGPDNFSAGFTLRSTTPIRMKPQVRR